MNYTFKNVNSLVARIDFSKFSSGEFTPPNLRGIQIGAYREFLSKGLEELVSRYFPIVSSSGNIKVLLEGIVAKQPQLTEEQAVDKSESYQVALYLKLRLISNFRSESDEGKVSEIFFGHIPIFSSSCNFIINGTEKFVISQIVRSPGLYVLNKAQIRLSNSRKRTQEGIVCELLPVKGALILFHLPNDKSGKPSIKLLARNTSGNNAISLPVTTFMKAFGFTQEMIQDIFVDHPEVLSSLNQEVFNTEELKAEPIFVSIINELSTAKNTQKLRETSRGWIKHTLYSLCVEYYELEKTTNKSKKKDLLEKIYIELAARAVTSSLSISPEVARREVTSYQELLWSYLFDKYYYNILPAGRYKLNHKLSV